MKPERKWWLEPGARYYPLVMLCLIATLALPGRAASQTLTSTQPHPGNYCISCHTPGDIRLATATEWRGDIGREVISPCPAVSRVHEEIYYTERLLLAVDRARAALPSRTDTTRIDARISSARQTYGRLLETPVNSLEAFVSEAQTLRYRLGRSYAALNQALEDAKQQNVHRIAMAVTLFLLISLGAGLVRTSRLSHTGPAPATGIPYPGAPLNGHLSGQGAGGRRARFNVKAALALLFVLGFFTLPLTTVPTNPSAPLSAPEQANQTALDTADRAAGQIEGATARTWALARVGAFWAQTNPSRGDEALAAALASATDVRLRASAAWGEARAVQEKTIDSAAAQEKALLAVRRLEAAHARAWALRLVAAEWKTVAPGRAEEILEVALEVAQDNQSPYRDLDLRGIAVTWASIDVEAGISVADRVADPALRAWAFREIADIAGERALYERAAGAARLVQDTIDRARALREIAARAGDQTLFDEAIVLLQGLQVSPAGKGAAPVGPEDVPVAYSLAELAAASGRLDVAEHIGEACPAAWALYLIGSFGLAWAVAARIADPFEQARAQEAIARKWLHIEKARQIVDPTLRDRALCAIAAERQDLDLAKDLTSPYYRIQAFTSLGHYETAVGILEASSRAARAPREAAPDAGRTSRTRTYPATGLLATFPFVPRTIPAPSGHNERLSDSYPLRGLAVALAGADPQAAQALVEKIDREADKAVVLRMLAMTTGEHELFERSLDMAAATRVRGDPLAQVETLLALAQGFEGIDPIKAERAYAKAYEAALR